MAGLLDLFNQQQQPGLLGQQAPQRPGGGGLFGVLGMPGIGNAFQQMAPGYGNLQYEREIELRKLQQQEQYQNGMLDIARRNANRHETPAQLQILHAAGIDPKSPVGHKALFPRTDTPISPTDKKAIMSAEDDVPRLNATIANVQRAMELNPQVYSGAGASVRGWMGAKLPDALVPDALANPKQGAATAEWDQLMGQEAIKMMSETLKGASTDFEMRKFLGIAADTSQPVKNRQNAMERFTSLAQEELALRKRRASELRSGDYFKPGNDGTRPAAPAASAGGRPDPQRAMQEAQAAIAKGADRNAVMERLRQMLEVK